MMICVCVASRVSSLIGMGLLALRLRLRMLYSQFVGFRLSKLPHISQRFDWVQIRYLDSTEHCGLHATISSLKCSCTAWVQGTSQVQAVSMAGQGLAWRIETPPLEQLSP